MGPRESAGWVVLLAALVATVAWGFYRAEQHARVDRRLRAEIARAMVLTADCREQIRAAISALDSADVCVRACVVAGRIQWTAGEARAALGR